MHDGPHIRALLVGEAAGAVALVDDWLFGEGEQPLRVPRRAMRAS
jgi:hypothetical protein